MKRTSLEPTKVEIRSYEQAEKEYNVLLKRLIAHNGEWVTISLRSELSQDITAAEYNGMRPFLFTMMKLDKNIETRISSATQRGKVVSDNMRPFDFRYVEHEEHLGLACHEFKEINLERKDMLSRRLESIGVDKETQVKCAILAEGLIRLKADKGWVMLDYTKVVARTGIDRRLVPNLLETLKEADFVVIANVKNTKLDILEKAVYFNWDPDKIKLCREGLEGSVLPNIDAYDIRMRKYSAVKDIAPENYMDPVIEAIDLAKGRYMMVVNENSRLAEKLKDSSQTAESLRKKLDADKDELEGLKKEISVAKESLLEYKSKIEELMTEIRELKENCEKEISAAKEKSHSAIEERDKIKAELDKIRARENETLTNVEKTMNVMMGKIIGYNERYITMPRYKIKDEMIHIYRAQVTTTLADATRELTRMIIGDRGGNNFEAGQSQET